MKKISLIIVMMVIMVLILTSFNTVFAKSYVTYSSYGVKYIAYTKNTIYWSSGSIKITSYDTEQTKSGLFVQNAGIKKNSSSSSDTKYVFHCKNKYLVGAVLGGVTLGYVIEKVDRANVFRNGNNNWQLNI